MGKKKKKVKSRKSFQKALNFKVSKKAKKSLFVVGFFATLLFIAFALFFPQTNVPPKSSPAKKSVPITKTKSVSPNPLLPKASPTPRPIEKTALPKPEPTVYFKKTDAPKLALKPVRRLSGKPKIVFVLDDMGNTNHYLDELYRLGDKVTYAILPFLAYSTLFDTFSLKTGAEAILHLPLESTKGTIPGPGLITSAMPDAQILDHLRRNLSSTPHVSGVNNHMGSKGTADRRVMSIILPELKSRGFFFLDSKTTSQSVAIPLARQIGIPALSRDEFLDNEDTQPAIHEEIKKLAKKSLAKGYAIGIGHYRFNTLKALQTAIPELEREGFEIVSLRDLLAYLQNRK